MPRCMAFFVSCASGASNPMAILHSIIYLSIIFQVAVIRGTWLYRSASSDLHYYSHSGGVFILGKPFLRLFWKAGKGRNKRKQSLLWNSI